MTDTLTMTGADLRGLRQAAGLSLAAVTDDIEGLSINDLSNIELGRKEASEEMVGKIVAEIRELARTRAEAVGAA